jgi:nucleoside-diphosphate-sugar epimerase
LETRLVAVTGATGFLGRHLVQALVKQGWTVRVLTRRDPVYEGWRNITPQIVIGDVADPGALQRLCAGAQIVIHAAGLIKAPSRAVFDAVNRDGAALAAEAAKAAGAHMILISSLAAREPGLSDYAASKRAGEEAAAAVLGGDLSVVRPPAIYGPGDRETLSIFAAAQRTALLPVISPSARICLVHVTDAAAQIAALASNPRPGVFALSDPRRDGYGWGEVMSAAAAAVGRQARLIAIPPWTIRIAALICAFLTGGRAIFGPGKARELLHSDWSVEGSPVLDTPPARIGLNEGFAQVVIWYRGKGWL